MIPSLLLLTSWALAQDDDAPAEDAPAESEEDDDPLSKHRTDFDVLADRAIGMASKPVAFDWRRTKVHIAGNFSVPFELNNFQSLRGGGLFRFPSQRLIAETAIHYAETWDTPSTELLALTPYRQPGRPNRLELDFGVAYPLAEGVVTAFPKFFPAAQLVFNLHVGVRYRLYPAGWPKMRPGQVAGAIINPAMTEIELDNLDDNRPDSMQVDSERYGLTFGIGNDLYFAQGIFLSPRLIMALPILAPASGTQMVFWADLNIALGVAF